MNANVTKTNSIVITSAHTLADLKKVQDYRPAALTLTEGEGDNKHDVYKVVVGSAGSINKYGACFADATYGDGKAFVEIGLPKPGMKPTEVQEFYRSKVGMGVVHMNAIEAQVTAALADIAAAEAAMNASLEFDAAPADVSAVAEENTAVENSFEF